MLSIIYCSECDNVQNLYDNNSYVEAMELINANSDCLESEEFQYLKFLIAFKLEDFDLSRQMLDLLLKNNQTNQKYIESSNLLTKVLQEYKSSKYTLDNLDVNDAILEYNEQLKDTDLSKISLFYHGLASAYKTKDSESSASDTLNFEYLDLSIKNYNIAIDLNPLADYQKNILNISKFLTLKGRNSLDEEDYSSAMTFFSKSISYDKTYHEAHFKLGDLYYLIEDFELAIDNYKNGLKYFPKKPIVLWFLGRSFERIGDVGQSEDFYKLSLDALSKSNLNKQQKKIKVKALLSLGRILYSTQQYESAIFYLEDLVSFYPKYKKAYALLSDIYVDLKEIDKAKNYCFQGIDNDEFAYELYVRLARIFNDENKYESAIEYANLSLEKAEKFRFKDYGPALIELGNAHVYLCNKVRAEDAFNRAESYDRSQVRDLRTWSKEHFRNACN